MDAAVLCRATQSGPARLASACRPFGRACVPASCPALYIHRPLGRNLIGEPPCSRYSVRTSEWRKRVSPHAVRVSSAVCVRGSIPEKTTASPSRQLHRARERESGLERRLLSAVASKLASAPLSSRETEREREPIRTSFPICGLHARQSATAVQNVVFDKTSDHVNLGLCGRHSLQKVSRIASPSPSTKVACHPSAVQYMCFVVTPVRIDSIRRLHRKSEASSSINHTTRKRRKRPASASRNLPHSRGRLLRTPASAGATTRLVAALTRRAKQTGLFRTA